MSKIKINKSQIIGKKPMGVLVGCEGWEKYKNVVIAYICGDIPVLVSTNLTDDEWDATVENRLTAAQRFKLSTMGVI